MSDGIEERCVVRLLFEREKRGHHHVGPRALEHRAITSFREVRGAGSEVVPGDLEAIEQRGFALEHSATLVGRQIIGGATLARDKRLHAGLRWGCEPPQPGTDEHRGSDELRVASAELQDDRATGAEADAVRGASKVRYQLRDVISVGRRIQVAGDDRVRTAEPAEVESDRMALGCQVSHLIEPHRVVGHVRMNEHRERPASMLAVEDVRVMDS